MLKTGLNSIKKKIGTHDGRFHCDEVLACVLIKLLPDYKNAEIIRTRIPNILDSCDIVVDVGGIYDSTILRFDHHQRTFNESMCTLDPSKKWKTKLSSAGLIYFHFGHKILSHLLNLEVNHLHVNMIYDKIYENFVEAIDAIDNGIKICENPKYTITTDISSRIQRLNPQWNDLNEDIINSDNAFSKALDLVSLEFMNILQYYKLSWLPAFELIKNAVDKHVKVRFLHTNLISFIFKNNDRNEILVLEHYSVPWIEHLLYLEKIYDIEGLIKYVLYMDHNKLTWKVHAVPVKDNDFTSRLPLPEKWRGLRDEQLEEVAGIKDFIFVHANGFIGGCKNKTAALLMAEISLKLVK